KHITDKQVCYIINTVIIPILEYRIYNIILSQTTCNKILSSYLSIAKHKSNLATTTPNSTLLNHNIYGIKNIWDIQLQYHISNFLTRLSDTGLLGTSTQIRLQQLQNNLWSTTNILQHPQPQIDGPNKHSTNFKIILLCNYLNIPILTNTNNSQPTTISDPYTPLEKILQHNNFYNSFKHQLRIKQILFLEQLTSADNYTLLDWTYISPRLNYLSKGRKPKWFTTLEIIILDYTSTRVISNQFWPLSNNSLAYTTGHYSIRAKPWLITYLLPSTTVIVSKAQHLFSEKNTVSITHWTLQPNSDSSNLYPYLNPTCFPCQSCNLNSKKV